MDSRQQFEECVDSRGLRRTCSGSDEDQGISLYWIIWQASRESLVVDRFSTYKFEGCKYYDAESVDDALTDAGINRK